MLFFIISLIEKKENKGECEYEREEAHKRRSE